MTEQWARAQDWERAWWGQCTNTLNEVIKQLTYARYMGLEFVRDAYTPYNLHMDDRQVVDIGGGPTSLLLRCVTIRMAVVVDPMPMPEWVALRYATAGIDWVQKKGENWESFGYDEAWIYNVLQHTDDPKQVIKRARAAAKLIRLFEWIDTPTNAGHPHSLRADLLDQWLGGEGKRIQLNGEGGCFGKAYCGIFNGSS